MFSRFTSVCCWAAAVQLLPPPAAASRLSSCASGIFLTLRRPNSIVPSLSSSPALPLTILCAGSGERRCRSTASLACPAIPRRSSHINMASTATASATMAAAGFDKRASTASSFLQTPGSASFPSELCSPSVGSPGFLRRETDLRTPITPPSAYLDFLKNMSPAMLSPAPTSACARFSFSERPAEQEPVVRDDKKLSITPPTSQPPLSRNTSYDSNASTSTSATEHSVSSTASHSRVARTKARPESPRVIIPPSPFAKPGPMSARTPRRLHIPQSPFSPAMPTSQSLTSPFSSTPLSATPWSATHPPREKDLDGSGKRVCVRQVVTRTVTYCRTPLEPAPRGKRRKIEIQPPTPVAEVVAIKSEADGDVKPCVAAATAAVTDA